MGIRIRQPVTNYKLKPHTQNKKKQQLYNLRYNYSYLTPWPI